MRAPANIFFIQDFDAPPPASSAQADVPATLYTAEQMAASREAAWQEGHAAARAGAEDADVAKIRAHLDAIDTALRAAHADLAAEAETTALELSRFLLTALSAALPGLCARHGMAEIQAIASEILPTLSGEPIIHVRVADEHMTAMQEHLAHLGADLLKKIQFTADDQLGPSDITIRWDRGEAVRDFAQIWNGIAAILDRQGLPLLAPANQTQEREPAHVE